MSAFPNFLWPCSLYCRADKGRIQPVRVPLTLAPAPRICCDATTGRIEIELYHHLTLLDIFKVSPPPRKRETSGPNPRLSSDSVPPVHLQQDSKQRPSKWNAWAERQRTIRCTWIDWNELVLTKPGKWERVPSKLWGLICLTEWETPQSQEKTDPWLVHVGKKWDTCFLFSSSHYHTIRTAVWIKSLIGSVKPTQADHTGTTELNSMSHRLQCSKSHGLSNNAGWKENRQVSEQNNPIHITHQHPAVGFCFAISLQLSLAGLITRAAAILQDKFPHNRNLILSVGHLNSSFL